MRRRAATGLALIVIGAALQLVQLGVVTGDLTVLALGIALLVGYAFTGHYGLLVPGGILTGLGAGLLARQWAGTSAGAISLGLGLGFLAIALIEQAKGMQRPGGWWPVLPGTILTAFGVLLIARATGWLELLSRWWPLALVLIGLWMLIRRSPEEGLAAESARPRQGSPD